MRPFRERLLTFSLIGVILASGVALINNKRRLSQLQAHAKNLQLRVGALEIDDPSQIHIRLIDSLSPTHKLWRIYLPPNVNLRFAHENVAGGSGWSTHNHSEPIDGLLRWRLEGPDDQCIMHLIRPNGSASNSFSPKVASFLRKHWEELEFEIAGTATSLSTSPDEIATVFQVDLPESLHAAAKESLSNYAWQKLKSNPLIRVEIGSDSAFQTRESQRQQDGAFE